jgi:putative transposase
VRKILKEAGLGLAGEHAGLPWREFLRAQAQSMITVDFFTVETVAEAALRVVLHRAWQPAGASRRLNGDTERRLGHPAGPPARLDARRSIETVRFLLRDRDTKFTRDFDTVMRSEAIQIIRTPVWAPKANAIAERFVRTARSECLDWLLTSTGAISSGCYASSSHPPPRSPPAD